MRIPAHDHAWCAAERRAGAVALVLSVILLAGLLGLEVAVAARLAGQTPAGFAQGGELVGPWPQR